MGFNLQVSNQSEILKYKINAAIYEKVHAAGKKHHWIRATGFIVGISTALISIAARIALIGENIIKGLGNILGALFFEKCCFDRGLYQLISGTLTNIAALPATIFCESIGMIITTVSIASKPIDVVYDQWCDNNPELKKAQIKLTAQNGGFAYVFNLVQKDPTNIEALKSLGLCYKEGLGVEKNFEKSLKYYLMAADLGDGQAMASIGKMYYQGEGIEQDCDKAFQWFKKAADKGQPEAMGLIGLYYATGNLVPKNLKEAFKWFLQAANKDNPLAMGSLADFYAVGQEVEKNLKEADKWYRKALEMGDTQSLCHFQSFLKKYPEYNHYPEEWKDVLVKALKHHSQEKCEKAYSYFE